MKNSMHTAIDYVTKIIGYGISPIFNYRNKIRISIFFDKIHTYANAKYFNILGNGVRISRSCTFVNPEFVSIGFESSIGPHSTISVWNIKNSHVFKPCIKIGTNTSIGSECHLTAINSITIGNGVLIGKKNTITDNSHGEIDKQNLFIPPAQRKLVSKGPIIIEDNVWIGDKVSILAGSRIGYGAIIGANSVVNGYIPPMCVAAGIPAKVVKML